MSDIDSRIWRSLAKDFLFKTLPAGLIGCSIVLYRMVTPLVLAALVSAFLLLATCFLSLLVARLSLQKPVTHVDRPLPTLVDLMRLVVWPICNMFLILLGTFPFVVFIWEVQGTEVWTWLVGVGSANAWQYLFTVIGSLTTYYAVTEQGVYVSHGLDEILLPFSEINSISLYNQPFFSLSRPILYPRALLVPAVRNHTFVRIKRMTRNRLWFEPLLEVYLTPANPMSFMEAIQTRLAAVRD